MEATDICGGPDRPDVSRRIPVLGAEAGATLRGSVGMALLLDSLVADPYGAHHLDEAAKRAGKTRAQLAGLMKRFVGVTWHEFVMLHRLALAAAIWHDGTLKPLVIARKAGCSTVRTYGLALLLARALPERSPRAIGIRLELFQLLLQP